MPRKSKANKGLEPTNKEQFKELAKSNEGKQFLLDFVFTLADIMDDMITEDNTFITWGMSKDGSRWNFVLHEGRLVYYANGVDFRGILTEVISL